MGQSPACLSQAPALCRAVCHESRFEDGAGGDVEVLDGVGMTPAKDSDVGVVSLQECCNDEGQPEADPHYVGVIQESCIPAPIVQRNVWTDADGLVMTPLADPLEDEDMDMAPEPVSPLALAVSRDLAVEEDAWKRKKPGMERDARRPPPTVAKPRRDPSPVVDARKGHILERFRLLVPHRRLRFEDYYEVGTKAGEGSFGNVYQAWSKPWPSSSSSSSASPSCGGGSPSNDFTRRQVAVKAFQLTCPDERSTPRSSQEDVKKRTSFEAERAMLATLEHPHIVRMYECFEESNTYYIVLELCRGGELYKRLVNKVQETGKGGFDESLCRVFLRQMLFGLAYLHSKRIVHRDVKTENFLLVGEAGSPEEDVLKLCDFGTSVMLSDQQPRCMENIGTLSYTAPEVYANMGADVKADVWSLGVVLYILLTGANPFRLPGKASRDEVVERIRTGNFETKRKVWQQLGDAAQDLVRHLLVVDEYERLTCVQALRHHWVESPSDTADPVRSARSSPAPDDHHLAEHVPAVVALLLQVPRLAAAQRVALTTCALAASEADLSSEVPWRELFLTLDADQDGRLSFSELAEGLGHLLQLDPRAADDEVPDDERLEACIHALDLNQSGSIEWTEWLALALLGSPFTLRRPEPAGTAFRLLDRPLCRREGEFESEIEPPIMISEMIRDWAPSPKQLKRAQTNGSVGSIGSEVSEFTAAALQSLADEAVDGDGDGSPYSSDQVATQAPFSVADLQLVLTSLEVY